MISGALIRPNIVNSIFVIFYDKFDQNYITSIPITSVYLIY